MTQILINEILFFDEEEILYKTINETKTLYGIHSSKRRTIIKPTFLHIFKFGGSATKTVAINESDEYIWLDYNGLTHPLDEETREEYRSTIIKNSRCNCYNIDYIKTAALYAMQDARFGTGHLQDY